MGQSRFIKRIAFGAADVFLLEVGGAEGYAFIAGSMERHEFRFPQILRWIQEHSRPVGLQK